MRRTSKLGKQPSSTEAMSSRRLTAVLGRLGSRRKFPYNRDCFHCEVPLDVVHDIDHSRFVLSVDGSLAEIQYARVSDRVLDLRHTEVPPELQHRGVGDALAIAAFDYARANGVRLILTCPFLRRWILSHPEQRDIVIWNRGGETSSP